MALIVTRGPGADRGHLIHLAEYVRTRGHGVGITCAALKVALALPSLQVTLDYESPALPQRPLPQNSPKRTRSRCIEGDAASFAYSAAVSMYRGQLATVAIFTELRVLPI